MTKKNNKRILWLLPIAVIIIVIYIYNYLNAPVYPYVDSPRPFLGQENSSVLLTEFSDLECPACRMAHPTVKRVILEYQDEIRFEFKHFPLKTIHPYAQKAAEAAECANDQGRFWEYIDMAYISTSLNTLSLKNIAEKLELNMGNFTLCLKSGAKSDIVDLNFAEAVSLNLPGTPMLILNGRLLENWEYDYLKEEIDKELAK